MPEGDTIAYAARRIRPILVGHEPTVESRHGATHGWGERLSGHQVTAIETYGKHLFIRFEHDLLIHSHLRMTGTWHTGLIGARWRRAPRRAWLRLTVGDHEVVQFDGPVLDLLTGLRARIDRRVAQLGPDVLGEDFDNRDFLHRLRQDDPTRPFGDTLLDQRIVAGLGTIWRAESLFDAGVSPLTPNARITDEQACAVIAGVRPRMADSAQGGRQMREKHVYGHSRCSRCSGRIDSRGLGDDNRRLYWCPSCQR